MGVVRALGKPATDGVVRGEARTARCVGYPFDDEAGNADFDHVDGAGHAWSFAEEQARLQRGHGDGPIGHDGITEHRTVIEAGAFVGSGAQLVAPLTIGKGAYVGAGTTVTRDVPRSGLALSRVKQVNVDGWADRFREAKTKRGR